MHTLGRARPEAAARERFADKSARNLTAALDGLSAVLPRARRVTRPRTGHTAADNSGKPELVAAQLRAFFISGGGI